MGPHNKSGEVAGLPNSAAGRQSSALREGRARMAAEAHNGGCSPRYWLLTIAALVVAALFSGAAYAAVLDSREAEQMTLGTGAAISGSHVILNATGERVTWVDGGAAGGTSVTATARHNGNGTSRVGLALYVNGVDRGSQFWARSVTANAERTWTGLNLSDGDDLEFRAVEVGSREAVLFDRARVDGTVTEPPAADSDDDGLPDPSDRCPGFPDSADADGDATPDGCDAQDNRDSDGDGVQNYQDACPTVAGPVSNNGCPESEPPLTRYDVRDFGATPNDASDDTAAFEDAMAAAGANEVVYVPAGTYRVANVGIPGNTTVEIESTATIKKFGTGNGPVFSMRGVANTSFVQNIHVYGVNGKFCLDMSDAPQDTTGFRLRSVKNFSIKNMDALGRDNDPAALTDANGSILKPVISFVPMDTTQLNGEWEHPKGGVIENVTATEQAFGWGLTQLTGAEDIHFQDISSTGGVALRLENFEYNVTTVDDVTADNVTCIDGKNAVTMNPHNADNGDVHITDVTVNSCYQAVSLADDPAFPNANFDSTSTIDNVDVTAGSTAQVNDPGGPRGCYEPVRRMPAACWRKRQANATK